MSYRMSVDVIGAEQLEQAFRESSQLTIRELSRAIGSTAYRVEGVAKAKAPIEYGTLRGSITTQGPDVKGHDVQAIVGTNVEYARYQEYGTGIHGPRKQPIRPVRGKLLAWKRGGSWFFAREVQGVRPKRYFRTAKEENRPVFVEHMREALTRIVGALARA
jgi:phage gpG-like protein